MCDTVEIYEILDPRDGSVRYIGKANNSAKRFAGHLREVRRRTPLYDWLKKMRDTGLTPTYRIAMVCPKDVWPENEIKAIAEARACGANLLNVAAGGYEPYCSPETRARNGRMVAQKRRDDPMAAFLFHVKKTLSTALKKGQLLPETKAKMRLLAIKMPDIFGAWSNV